MMPENRKSRFNALSDRWQAAFSASSILFSYQQTVIFFEQFILKSGAAITQITNHRLKTQKFCQCLGNRAIGIIAGRQNDITNSLFGSCQNVQFETEKPALR